MKPLFSREHADVLAQLAWTRLLLAFDYDGTLAPIVADRDRAGMRPRTATLLKQVAARYPTAVISGRSKADVASRVHGLGIRHVVGNHGLEPGAASDLVDFERVVGQARVLLEQQLDGLAGLDIEDKVVNVIPAAAPHKGDAVIALRDAERADTVLYVGDDITDEDVFALDQPGRLVTVRIGASSTSRATYYVRGQREIDDLLAALVALR